MNNEYINANGYMLLAFNIVCLLICISSSFVWGNMAIYEKAKPKCLKFINWMFAASLVSIIANSAALIRMFDSFLMEQLHINQDIIRNTIIDRFGMLATFGILLLSAFKFKDVCRENNYI